MKIINYFKLNYNFKKVLKCVIQQKLFLDDNYSYITTY